MIIGDNKKYIKVSFENEQEIEKVVFDNFELLFGSMAILLPKRKIQTLSGVGTIPDGIIIDFQNNRWSILEAELAQHGTWEHIAPQIAKQLTAMRNSVNIELLSSLALELIATNKIFINKLSEEFDIKAINIHSKLNSILRKNPSVALPIDEIPSDLREWAETLQNTVEIWEIQKFINTNDNSVLYSIPDDAIPSLSTSHQRTEVIKLPIYSRGELFRKLINEGLLTVDEQLHMDYGMRGKKRQRYYGKVNRDGIEIDGRVYSPSYAAVTVMQKAGSIRPTANGWLHWKNKDGQLIDSLLKKIIPT